MIKILAIHSVHGDDESKKSAVDFWRIYRPLKELEKHVDWQIDHQPTFIKGFEKYTNAAEFTPEEMERAFENICQYDIVFSSYHADPTAYSMLKVAADKAGVQFVMDVDDDMFAVNPDNPFWIKMDDEKCYWMQCMIRDNAWVSTTNKALADRFRDRRAGKERDSVFVVPNFLPSSYKHPKFDNGEKIVIGYFGGSSHYADLHETGVAEALKRLMIEDKRVHFKAVGMPLDKYVPRGRYTFQEGKRGSGWVNEIYPTLNMDIALGPLVDNIFNCGKSNIKWQESTRAGACFVASRIGPYATTLPEGGTVLTENTSDAWYQALKSVVDDTALRKKTVATAKKHLKEEWCLENNWQRYRDMFLKVKEHKDANS